MPTIRVNPRPVAAAVAVVPTAHTTPAYVRHEHGYAPGRTDIFFLGITLVISGQFFSWNLGLAAGLYSYLIIYVLMGLAYVAFCCCVAEVTSALPFAGGAFGLARCTLGFFPAYLIGCCEAIEYIASVAVTVLALADLLALVVPSLDAFKPLVWLTCYVSTVALQVRGRGAFWGMSLVVGALSLSILLVYNFGVMGHVDLPKNTVHQDPTQQYVGGIRGAMAVLPYAAWFFLGVEALNLASDDVQQPETQIPQAQVACISTLFVTGLFTFLTTVALPTEGGVLALADTLAPLNNGFMTMLGVKATVATLLTVPSQYAAAYGLSWASSKLIHGMAQSKLLPPVLATTSKKFQTPFAAIIVTAVLGYAVCLAVHLKPAIGNYLLPLCLLFAFTSYSGQCIGYLSLRTNYPLVRKRHFRNPFGIFGALYSLAVWVASIVAIFGFQPGWEITLGLFTGTLVLLSVYYVLVAKARQVMSEHESRVLLKAHILKFNSSRRRSTGTFRQTQRSRASGSSATKRVPSWKNNASNSSS